ncbi:galactosyl transferase GMA12/MNN10 family-domain-containing protein [Polychytrium aggregatum]|uniref:galactosyl transferase GMA12/MNN10 family-domain-containing protein n=1 Tax=Polychytrium aggregatum TaxID=110093 RepID=UPI0022FDCB3E|nr:galactosyl transferase GMA12/MNN10 family-domain-containing protein [Polychytrium aggregatum]KAI9197063.1 galactosyl transferase GMA12/MNN10 family-domain-containing protein [Polychytrium aggregatum]
MGSQYLSLGSKRAFIVMALVLIVSLYWVTLSVATLAPYPSSVVDSAESDAEPADCESSTRTPPALPKIAILVSDSSDTRDRSLERHSRVYVESVQLKEDYAKRHGYAFFIDSVIDKSRPHWGRLGTAYTIMNTMPWIEWILYMDVDTMIMEPDLSLEDLLLRPYMRPNLQPSTTENDRSRRDQPQDDQSVIQGAPVRFRVHAVPPRNYQEIDFIAKSDCTGRPLNNGVYFMRNSNWTIRMLEHVFNDRTDYAGTVQRPGVQDAMTNVLMAYPPAETRHFIMGPKEATFNKYTEICTDDEDAEDHWYRKGDFALHLAGIVNREELWTYYIRMLYQRYPLVLHQMLAALKTKWFGRAPWVEELESMVKSNQVSS